MAQSLSLLSIVTMLCFLVLLSCGTCVQSRTTPPHEEANSEMMEMYEEWLIKYNRVHKSLEEKNQRFEIFKNNVELINTHNKEEGHQYYLAVNKFADLTSEEFKAKYTGFRPQTQNELECNPQKLDQLHDDVPIPKSIDWRTKGAVTSIKNQQECGSCWAFGVVGSVEGITQIKTGKLIDLSPQELVDCDNTDDACSGGLMDKALTWIINNNGLNSEEAYPYTGKEGKCNEKKRTISVANITGYECVTKNNEKALEAAVSKQPVTVGIEASDKFRFYESGVFNDTTCTTMLNHAVVAVGYDTLEDGTSYWIVKNSWGDKDWGEEGYIRMLKDVDAEEGMCGIAMYGIYPVM